MTDRASQVVKRHLPSFWLDFIVVCVVFVTVLVLYGSSLAYPFVWYDADDLLRAIKYSVPDLFSGVASYQYYRPLIFTLWKAILTGWGPDSAPILHASLIGAHALNAVLLYTLIRDLARSRWPAFVAALLFTVYPFNYQAVTWAIAHQPSSMALVLAALLIYTRARRRRQKTHTRPHAAPDSGHSLQIDRRASSLLRHLAALACLVAGMLMHESAFVGAGLIILIEAYLVRTRSVQRMSLWPLAYLALTILLFVLYASAARSNPDVQTFETTTALYLLQGFVYPVAMLLARICGATGCNSVALLPAFAIATVMAMLVAWRLERRLLLGLLGAAWFGLGVAPVWAGRDYLYAHYAPRLLYLASAGAALAIAAAVGAGRSARGLWPRAAVVAAVALQSGSFVAARQPLHDEAFRLMAQANAAMFAPRQGSALFVNTVELFAYKEPEFPLGWFGVLVSPWHNRLVETLHLRAEPDADWLIDPAQAEPTLKRSQLSLEFHGRVASPQQFHEALAGASDVYRVEALASPPGALHLFKVASIERNPPDATPLAAWSDPLYLMDAAVEVEADTPVLTLDWAIAGQIDLGQTVFVHVQDAGGAIVAQADGDPIGSAPLGGWPLGTVIRERRPLLLPPDLPSGMYSIYIGLYRRDTLERVTPTHSIRVVTGGALLAGSFDIP